MQKRLVRADVPVELTWDLSDLFASEALWEAEFEALDAACDELEPFRGRSGESAATLARCLDAVESLQVRLMRVSTFAYLRNAQDGTNPDHQASMARVNALAARLGASVAFVDSEALALPEGIVERFLAEDERLAAHRAPLERLLETRPHRLGAEAEGVLASLGEVLGAPYMIYQRSKASDIQFAPFIDANGTQHPNSFSLYETSYESHADTSVRRGAWQSFSAGLKAYNNTYAATIATEARRSTCCNRTRCPWRSTPACWRSSALNSPRTCSAMRDCGGACSAWTGCSIATSRHRSTPTSNRTSRTSRPATRCSRRWNPWVPTTWTSSARP
jgi:oligoendopeptidase F